MKLVQHHVAASSYLLVVLYIHLALSAPPLLLRQPFDMQSKHIKTAAEPGA